MKKTIAIIAIIFLTGIIWLGWYLFKPLDHQPTPAQFACYDLDQGTLEPLPALSGRVWGVGLSYATHIAETASDFTPGAPPPLFIKAPHSILAGGGKVTVPNSGAIISALDGLEPGLGERMQADYPAIPAMLDYEVELGVVLLEDISPAQLQDENFAPKFGFVVLNDLSARSLIFLGEGQANRYEYWGLSKGFPGFTPLTSEMWVPAEHRPDGIPCVTLETKVNGATRQSQSADDMIYTPKQMLRFVADKYPDKPLMAGDIMGTGTPGGVIMSTPAWTVRAANLVGLDRFAKLDAVIGRDGFLEAGDTVETSAEGLGSVTVTLE